MLCIEALLASLAGSRKIFHSEADFQHALAWQIHKAGPESQVRLEVNAFPDQDRRMFLDIWLPIEGIAIELKYVLGSWNWTRTASPLPSGTTAPRSRGVMIFCWTSKGLS